MEKLRTITAEKPKNPQPKGTPPQKTTPRETNNPKSPPESGNGNTSPRNK